MIGSKDRDPLQCRPIYLLLPRKAMAMALPDSAASRRYWIIGSEDTDPLQFRPIYLLLPRKAMTTTLPDTTVSRR